MNPPELHPDSRGNLIHPTAVIHPDATLGGDCSIGPFVQIGGNVDLGAGCAVEAHAIVGYDRLSRIWAPEMVAERTTIGAGALIRTGGVLYKGSTVGEECRIGHSVVLREGMHVGHHTAIGCLVKCEGYTTIGCRCVIHSQTHLTALMRIEDYVFMGPSCITMNDPLAAHYRDLVRTVQGPTIRRGARIGSGVAICPGVTVGEEAFIGAGSVVTKDVPPREFWFGNPAKMLKPVSPEQALHPVD